MILQFLLQIILLSLPTNALTLKSNSTSSSKNDSNSFLYAIEPNPSAGNCFDADRYRISNKSFIKKINWEVLEFSSVRDQKSYYVVKYCQAKIPWPLQRFNASVGDEEDGDQECSYTIYNSYFLEKVGDRLQLPADRISHESFIKRINLEVVEFFQGQEQKSYYGFGNCHAKILCPVQSRYLLLLTYLVDLLVKVC
ncbi:hypothetical protein Pint_28031 [Pistacia integerrima]|uniref:Uncharacterized protein n=1 Tax=Pistacia integerrima TaxID=434235 RepID=A0ACC0YTL1_9ROSI|nr:hypothetical protein Pint_28031 [Pistacia integerrima]